MTDFLQRFLFEGTAVRGELAQLDASLQTVLARHDYPPRVQTLLGELMTAALLLSATLKFEGSLILQARGHGPLDTLMAECNHRRELRAIAHVSPQWSATHEQVPLAELLADGQLAITIDPSQGQRYQGVVPWDGNTLAECLEHYFAQSEQLPTRLWLNAEAGRAGGLLLQVLPGGQDEVDAEGDRPWLRLTQLAATVTATELRELPIETVLYRLFHEESVRVEPAASACFHCSCSRTRTENALLSLGPDDLRALLEEKHGNIKTACQFCNQVYRFDRIDIENLLHGNRSPDSAPLH